MPECFPGSHKIGHTVRVHTGKFYRIGFSITSTSRKSAKMPPLSHQQKQESVLELRWPSNPSWKNCIYMRFYFSWKSPIVTAVLICDEHTMFTCRWLSLSSTWLLPWHAIQIHKLVFHNMHQEKWLQSDASCWLRTLAQQLFARQGCKQKKRALFLLLTCFHLCTSLLPSLNFYARLWSCCNDWVLLFNYHFECVIGLCACCPFDYTNQYLIRVC